MYNNKYLELLHVAMIDLRYRLKDIDKNSYDLLNAIHNIPSLLEDKRTIHDSIIIEELLSYEEKYLNGQPVYSRIIEK